MTEMKIFAGKCRICSKRLDMRITDVKNNDKNPQSKVLGWMVYGYCKGCKLVYMQGLFQQEKKPIQDLDFTIDYEKEVEYNDKKQ